MATKQFQMEYVCPNCSQQSLLQANVDPIDLGVTPKDLVPEVRSRILPVGDITVYRITTDQMKQFIIEKTRKLVPDVKIEIAVNYCEKKKREKNEPHRSYASLRMAFSHHILKKHENDGWFGRVGESSGNVDIINSMFQTIIQRYQYDRKSLEKWIHSYKHLEELEENLGMSEKYIQELREYASPRRVNVAGSRDCWVIVNAAVENVIRDMLSNPTTDRPNGRLQIMDTYLISKDVAEVLVYVHPYETQLKENPEVRKILSGEKR